MSIETSDAIAGAAEADANARAKAIAIGAKWKCSRVRQWVGLDDCVKRYAEARDNGQYAQCLECASILRSLREMGCATPVNTKAPVSTEPQQEPKKITIIKEKPMPPKIAKPAKPKTAATSTPAKKGTPDPVMEEVKAVVETKADPTVLAADREVVTQMYCDCIEGAFQNHPCKAQILSEHAPEVKGSAATLTSPFEGWTKYDPMACRRAVALEFASISKTSISFSAAATERLRLKSYPTVTLYYQIDQGRIGIELARDESGVLKCTNETKGRAGVKVAAQGLIKALEIDPTQFKGKRFAVREIAPGFVEIDLKSEVAA